jgi:4a-hydroxytetrahydrobiopterin dehydratase
MKMPPALTSEKIRQALSEMPGWSGDENGIKKRFKFEDFRGAMQFMQACVQGIERLNHHPVWTNKFNVVDVHLDTFDIGHKVTQLDIDLAAHFERVLHDRGEEFGLLSDD